MGLSSCLNWGAGRGIGERAPGKRRPAKPRSATRREARFRNGAGLCQGFRASQKSRRRSHSSPSLRHKFRSLLFLFHCNRTSGLKDTPCPGFALPSVVSLMAATLCLVQIWSWVPIFYAYSAFADNLRAFRHLQEPRPGKGPRRTCRQVQCIPPLRIKSLNCSHSDRRRRSSACSGTACRLIHMRCKTTPMRRASAIMARFDPRLCATLSAQDCSQFGAPRCIRIIAA